MNKYNFFAFPFKNNQGKTKKFRTTGRGAFKLNDIRSLARDGKQFDSKTRPKMIHLKKAC